MKSPAGKVLIIGSSGMLGADLCKELGKKYHVTGTDVVGGRWSVVDSFFKSDITNRGSIEAVVAKAMPDAVIHIAAMTDVDGCELDPKKAYKINSDGTRNVAIACKRQDVPMVYMSTDFVFSGRKRSPYRESDVTGPLSVYGDSKLKGELNIRKLLKRYFIVRTSWLYGKHGKNFVDTIISKGRELPVLKVVDDQVGSPTYTVDLSKAIGVLLRKVFSQYSIPSTQYGIYHVSNKGSVSWCRYAREILKIAGVKTDVVPISSKELSRPAKRPAMSVMDTSKFSKFTGMKIRSWKRALKEYLSRENN